MDKEKATSGLALSLTKLVVSNMPKEQITKENVLEIYNFMCDNVHTDIEAPVIIDDIL